MRGKFNISLFIHLLIPWLRQAAGEERRGENRSAALLCSATENKFGMFTATHGRFISGMPLISELVGPEKALQGGGQSVLYILVNTCTKNIPMET